MANDGLSAGDRWARTVAEEIRRFTSLRPRPGRVFRYTPMPPEVRANQIETLGVWPLPQSRRDEMVDMVAKKMAGVLGTFTQRHGVIPEPEASRAAAAVEAEGYAASDAYAAGKDLSSAEVRFDVFQTYVNKLWASAYRYADARRQDDGTSGAGPAAVQPPAASVAVVSGPVQVQPPGRHLPLPPQG